MAQGPAAIKAGDGTLAEACIKDHVTIQGERFTDFVATLDHTFSG